MEVTKEELVVVVMEVTKGVVAAMEETKAVADMATTKVAAEALLAAQLRTMPAPVPTVQVAEPLLHLRVVEGLLPVEATTMPEPQIIAAAAVVAAKVAAAV